MSGQIANLLNQAKITLLRSRWGHINPSLYEQPERRDQERFLSHFKNQAIKQSTLSANSQKILPKYQM